MKKIYKLENGFTLMEIIVVIAVLALIMVSIIGVVVSVLKVQNRTKSNTRVVSVGNTILSELKKNLINGDSLSIICSEDKSSITFTNDFDGNTTIFNCTQGKIASISAQTVYLNGEDVTVDDCSQFVTCYTLPSLEISGIKFKFGVGSSIFGVGSSQNFEMDVTVRN